MIWSFLSLNGGCTGSSESTLDKMPYCWKSYVATQMSQFEILVYAQLSTSLNTLPEAVSMSFGCASSKGSLEIVRMPRII